MLPLTARLSRFVKKPFYKPLSGHNIRQVSKGTIKPENPGLISLCIKPAYDEACLCGAGTFRTHSAQVATPERLLANATTSLEMQMMVHATAGALVLPLALPLAQP